MNDGRDRSAWSKLEALLSECLAVPPPERAAIIARHRLSAKERDELQALLISAEQDTGAVLGGARLVGPDEEDGLAAGDRVGPYELIERIGAGGMGDVWRARRSGGTVKRDIALKLPRIALLDPSYQRRLLRESELLAQLAHPHITRLYDAGISEDDRPYMALELIDGQPIDQYCNARRVSLSARLRLFLQILDAVQYAHTHLIVHRDLKPSNILVTADGQVKLLDFGIAKLLDPLHGDAQDITRVHGHPLTPEYAAPEHFERRPITVAADLFSLGVLLFELLAGQRPFGADRARGLRLVPRQDDAAPASSAIAADHPARMGLKSSIQLRRLLQGDLDAIVAMALRIAPEERYSDADAFAADIRASLDKRPIIAVRESTWSRGRKFVRRNPLAVAMGTVAFAAVVGAFVGVNWQAQRALAAAAQAEQAARESQAVTRFLSDDLLTAANPTLGGDPQIGVQSLVDQAAATIDRRLRDTPGIAFTLHMTLGEVYESLGDHRSADREYRKARGVLSRRPDLARPDRSVSLLIQTARNALALPELERARTLIDEARLKMDEAWPPTHRLRLWAAAVEGNWHYRQGDFERAAAVFGPVVARAGGQLETDPALLHFAAEWLAIVDSNRGQFEAAAAAATDLQDALTRHYGPAHPRTLLAGSLLAATLREQGAYADAIARFKPLIPMLSKQLGPEHELVQVSRFELARTYLFSEEYDDAIPILESVYPRFVEHNGPAHEYSMMAGNALAVALERSGQNGAAAPIHLQLAAAAVEAQGPLHPHSLIYRSNAARARLHLPASDPQAAWTAMQVVLADSQQVFTDVDIQLGYLQRSAAVILAANGRFEEAIEALTNAISIFRQSLDEGSIQITKSQELLEDLRRQADS